MQGVYKIVHVATGRCYVGSTVNIKRRWTEHKTRMTTRRHPAIHLTNCWHAYGAAAFEFSILEECNIADEVTRKEREDYWMSALKPVFNVAPVAGSILGMKRSPEVRARMSAAQKGRPSKLKGRKRSPEACAAISAGKMGKTHSESHRANLSAALKGRKSPREGVTLSDETKAKISATKKLRFKLASLSAPS